MNLKRSGFWVLLAAPALSFAQINYNVQVKADHLENPGRAYLSHQAASKSTMDSATGSVI